MRPRTIITLVLTALVLVLGAVSFYGNVIAGKEAPADVVAPPAAGAPVSEPDGSAGGALADVIPAQLSGIAVTAAIDGEEAKLQTEQLHGKGLGEGFDAAWIAQYGTAGEGTLWVSRSASEDQAQVLMDRMSERIQAGQTPFQNFTATDLEGTVVIEMDGMGQKHYYFRAGTDLYWLAIAPGSAVQALNELLANARKVAGR